MDAVHLSLVELSLYAVVSLATATLGGVAGGGAGFINAPLLILFGLSPAQAVATGKLPGLSGALASLRGLRGAGVRKSKKQLLVIMGLALLIGLLAPLAITNLDSTLYRRILGVVMLGMIPVLFLKKLGHGARQPSARQQTMGYGLLAPAFLLQGVFGAGMSALVNMVLMGSMGMSALEANIVKRYTQVALNAVIVVGLLASQLIVWQAAFIGIGTAIVGGYMGARLAIRRGNTLILGVLATLAFASAMFLLVG